MTSGPIPQKLLQSDQALGRRAWIASILRTAAGVSLLQGLANSQEHQHSHSAMTPDSDDAATAWMPKFFQSQQNETLVALGDRIIPGSAAAHCNRVIDLVMTLQSKDHQDDLLHALGAFDNAATRVHSGRRFGQLSPQEQDAILQPASSEGNPLHQSFAVVKEWMIDTYWSSREGMRELGWNGQVAWTSFPACSHAEDREHLTSTGTAAASLR